MEGEVAENIGGGGGRALATHRAQSLDVNHLIADAVQDTVPLQVSLLIAAGVLHSRAGDCCEMVFPTRDALS